MGSLFLSAEGENGFSIVSFKHYLVAVAGGYVTRLVRVKRSASTDSHCCVVSLQARSVGPCFGTDYASWPLTFVISCQVSKS